MKMLNLLKLFSVLCLGEIYVAAQTVVSPCPKDFYYGKEYDREVGFFDLTYLISWYDYSNITDIRVEMKFYAPERTINVRNNNDDLLNITLAIQQEMVLPNIFNKKSIPFRVYFADEPLMLAEITSPPFSFDCKIKANESRAVVSAVYELKYSELEVEEAHKNFLESGGLVQKKCSTDEKGSPWVAEVRVNGIHRCTATLIGQFKALSDVDCFREIDPNLNPDDVELVLYNKQVLKIWKYESLWPTYTPIMMLLYIWPDHLSKQVVPACISTKFYKRLATEKMDHRIFFTDRQLNVNSSSIELMRDRGAVAEAYVTIQKDLFKKTDRGAAVMTKLEDGWYLSNILVDHSLTEYIVFSSVNRVLYNIIARRGKISSREIVRPLECRNIFQYGYERGQDVGYVVAEVPIGAAYTFNMTLEFYVPADIYEPRKPFNINVKRNGIGFDNEQKFHYTFQFPNNALPLKRVLFNNQVKCEDKSDTFQYNPTVKAFHALISEPIVSKEYQNYVSRVVNEPTCGKELPNSSDPYPWTASLFIEGHRYECLVSFISKRIAVTTVSCLTLVLKQAGQLTYEDQDLFVRLFNNEVLKVFQFNQHPDNIASKLKRPLGFLILEKEISAPGFSPICVWNDYEDTSNGIFVYLDRNETNFEVAFKRNIELYEAPVDQCEYSFYQVDDERFCAEPKGDSINQLTAEEKGGPFMYKYENKWHLKGLFHTKPPLSQVLTFVDTTDYYYWFRNQLAPVPILRSTCQEFQYGEEDGRNVGFLVLPVQRSQIYGFNVSLEFYLATRDPVPSGPINVTLQSQEDDLIEKILTRKPITYLVTFPDKALTIRRIQFSGSLVCQHLDDTFGRKPKTIVATHVFRPNIDVVGKFNRYIGEGINEVGCGNLRRIHKPLSFGGERVKKQDWPWVVSLYIRGEHKCSGTLITKSVAVSAAHCLEPGGFKAKRKDVTLLLFNNQYANIWDYIIHPYYDGAGLNDVALILLNEDLRSTDFVPICVWPFLEDINSLPGTLVGFGETELQESGKINRIDLTAVSATKCRASNKKFRPLVNVNTFCAKGAPGTGPCQGDSGGGFVFQDSGIWYLRGVVSASLINEYGECDTDNYTVFMDIEKYFDWIKNSNKTRHSNLGTNQSRSYMVDDQWVWE